MTGDFSDASIDRKPEYADAGFSSMVNFFFPKRADLDGITYIWQAYADSLTAHKDWHPFSYLNNSYHREADMEHMTDCATTLLLAPGVVQIFYGDETGRKLSDARLNVDADQAFRSDMNWNSVDDALLAHFQRLGTIRRQHPAIGAGRQVTIDNHTCLRIGEDETLVIRVKPDPALPIDVSACFSNGDTVTELYTGSTAIVEEGKVRFDNYRNKVAILCNERKQPCYTTEKSGGIY